MTSRRVLAVRADPAEAAPGDTVRWTVLTASPTGTDDASDARWAWCDARPSLAALAPAATQCLADGPWMRPFDGAAVTPVAADACRRFGPDPPESAQGEDARPVDPDVTGGYSAPVRVRAGDATALGFVRLQCGLAGATREQSAEWTRRRRPNQNPAIAAVSRVEGDQVTAVGESVTVSAGARVRFRVSWARCDDESSCTGAERYVTLDLGSRALVTQREEIRASWYATDGRFDEPRTGRSSSDPATETDNGFVAPSRAGAVKVWVVLRDDRGGVDWRALAVNVTP